MTPAQIRKAEQLLAKKKEMLTLVDRSGGSRGSISLAYRDNRSREPVLIIEAGVTVSIETVEKWVKQAKRAHKLGIIG